MEYDVFVLQIITDGPDGFPKDEVVDVGICGIDLERMETSSIYSMFVDNGTDLLNVDKIEYLAHSGINPETVSSGTPVENVCADVKTILKNKAVASFDIRNVFYRYMVNEPWDLTKEVFVMPSICSRLPTSQRCIVPSEENSKIGRSYRKMFSDDPMDIGESGRALDYALMSSAILMELRKRGRY